MKSNRSASGEAAFTLVELLVVLLIMATFATVVTPSVVQALRTDDVGATAEKMQEMLLFAYANSLAQRQTVMVNFDSSARRCWVTRAPVMLPWAKPDEAPRTRTLAAMKWPLNTQVAVSHLPSAAPGEASASSEVIRFRSNGRTEDVSIEIFDEKNQRRRIDVTGASGEVRID